jgi:hypothetical protein
MSRLARPTPRRRLAATAILLLGGLALPFSVAGHPGPIDDVKGCHVVACEYVDPSGEVLAAGSVHCHALPEDGLQLGGPPVRLRAPGEAEAPAPPCDAAPSPAPPRPEVGR